MPLPKTPDFIEGIISLRGDIIPVVDLRKRFELEERERDPDTRVIVVELEEFTVGVQVDKVYEVLKLDENDIEPPPPLVSGLKADYLEGVAEVNEHLITILDLDKIFSTTEKLILSDIEKDEEDAAAAAEQKKRTAKKKPAGKKGAGKAKEEAKTKTATVAEDGMVEFRGKSYFVGKKHASKDVELEEADGKLIVKLGGSKLKEFEL